MDAKRTLKASARLVIATQVIALIFASPLLLAAMPVQQADNPNPPAAPVKLIFVHHSTGGNWLADPNSDQPYGGLGLVLRDNIYYVSATNYGWGPDSIGDRTDILNWPEWFTGPQSDTYLNALYAESGQNVGDFGHWSRLGSDPGGENEVILFKSCFPNSDLYGHPDDPPAAAPNDQFTVSNAKAIYNQLLTAFETRQDKLFIIITAPPMGQGEYASEDQTPAERAANARAFNNWLVNDWLAGYPYHNVAVFDYYNVLTSNGSDNRLDDSGTIDEPNDAGRQDGNHHRWWNGSVQHVQTVDINYSAYPTDSSWDSHPTTAGHQKATAEFVPLLNVWYHRWQSGEAPPRPTPTPTTEQGAAPTATPPPEPTATTEQAEQPTRESPPAEAGIIADFERDVQAWESGAEEGSTMACAPDGERTHGGSAALRVDFDIQLHGWGDCGQHAVQDWSGGSGLSLWIRSEEKEQTVTLVIFSGGEEGPTPFEAQLQFTPEWTEVVLPWAAFERAQWADESGLQEVDPARMTGYGLNIVAEEGVRKGTLWIDDVVLFSGEVVSPTQAPPEGTAVPEHTATPRPAGPQARTATPEPAEARPTSTPLPEGSEEGATGGGFCPFSAVLLPLGAATFVWSRRQRKL